MPDPEITVECPLRFCVFTQAGICAEHPDGCPEHSCDWCEGHEGGSSVADPEIVRKVAEALKDATFCLLCRDLVTIHRDDIAEAVLAVAEPLIREQVAQEIEASRATNTFRTTVLERAAKIARGGQ